MACRGSPLGLPYLRATPSRLSLLHIVQHLYEELVLDFGFRTWDFQTSTFSGGLESGLKGPQRAKDLDDPA